MLSSQPAPSDRPACLPDAVSRAPRRAGRSWWVDRCVRSFCFSDSRATNHCVHCCSRPPVIRLNAPLNPEPARPRDSSLPARQAGAQLPVEFGDVVCELRRLIPLDSAAHVLGELHGAARCNEAANLGSALSSCSSLEKRRAPTTIVRPVDSRTILATSRAISGLPEKRLHRAAAAQADPSASVDPAGDRSSFFSSSVSASEGESVAVVGVAPPERARVGRVLLCCDGRVTYRSTAKVKLASAAQARASSSVSSTHDACSVRVAPNVSCWHAGEIQRGGRTGVVDSPDEANARRRCRASGRLLADVGQHRRRVGDTCGANGTGMSERSLARTKLFETRDGNAPDPPARHKTDSCSSAGSAASRVLGHQLYDDGEERVGSLTERTFNCDRELDLVGPLGRHFAPNGLLELARDPLVDPEHEAELLLVR